MERLKKILINPRHTIKQALKQMDVIGAKTLLVVDEQDTLCGTLTDGDVRRWILKGRDLAQTVSHPMNPDPFTLNQSFEREMAKKLMIKQKLECLPVVAAQRSRRPAASDPSLTQSGGARSSRRRDYVDRRSDC